MAIFIVLKYAQNKRENFVEHFCHKFRRLKNRISTLPCHDQSQSFAVSVQTFATSRISTPLPCLSGPSPLTAPLTCIYLTSISPIHGALYCFDCVNDAGNTFYLCECAHLTFVANMAVKVR